MNRVTTKTTLLIALLAFAVSGTKAQSDTTRSVYNESVVVVGDYSPVLDGVTEKVNVAPAINDNVAADLQPKFSYSITPRRMTSINAATSGIRAAKVTGSPSRLYNNYLRFGLGHDFAAFGDFKPLADLYYTSTRNDNYAYGARLYHRTDIASFGKRDDTQPSASHYGRNRHSETRIDLFGKYILKSKHLFAADLAYDRDYNRFYGFNDSTLNAVMPTTSRDDISFGDYAMAYNNIALNLDAKSLHTDVNKLGYQASAAMQALGGRYDIAQQSMKLDGAVHYGFPMFRQYKAVAYLHADWTGYHNRVGSPAHTTYPLGYTMPAGTDTNDVKAGRHITNINPYVDFLFKDFKIHAGFTFGIDAFSDTANNSHHFFPDLSVSKKLMDGALSFVVGFKGRFDVNDWNVLRQLNPFIGPGVDMKASRINSLYAHMRLDFAKSLSLNAGVDGNFAKNALFFVPDANYSLGNVYKPYYKDYNEIAIRADFTFSNDEMIIMTLGGEYLADLHKSTANMLPSLYDPAFTAHFDTRVNYKDKWLFTLQALFVSSVDANFALNPATNLYDVTETLPARFGLALNVEYVYSRALSFFLNLDNITAQRYYLWAHYPAERFNAMIGLTYTIPTKKK